ncbi:MAG: VOC family protein [Acidobacteriota bacterium]
MRARHLAIGIASMTLGAAPGEDVRGGGGASSLVSRVDHLVYATPDLDRGIDEIEKLIGVRAAPGGQHPGRGTRNAVLALGPASYLEIIAPDPAQPTPASPRTFGIDSLTGSRLAAWAVTSRDVEAAASEAAREGTPLGEVKSGSRKRPDGVLLSWRFTDPQAMVAGGVVPFLIDWGASPHPASSAPKGASLIALRAEHPAAARVQKQLRKLGLAMPVEAGPAPALIATIQGPHGRVELR